MAKVDVNIIISQEGNHLSVLNDLATSLFNARVAIEMRKDEYNIDDGLNNVRAYWCANEHYFKFVCRYKKDVEKIGDQIKAYAIINDLMLSE